jgi:hypothetical protein
MEIYSYDWSALEKLSTAAFGTPHRLAVLVLAAHLQADDLYAEKIERILVARPGARASESFVRRQLKALKDGGLLKDAHASDQQTWKERQPPATHKKGGCTPKLLRRSDDDFWRDLQALGDRFRRPSRQVIVGIKPDTG